MIATLTTIFKIIAGAGALAFVVRFAMTTWWRTLMGKHLMVFMATCGLLLTLAIVTDVLGDGYRGQRYVRLGAYALLAPLMWWRFGLLLVEQHRPRRAASGVRPDGTGKE